MKYLDIVNDSCHKLYKGKYDIKGFSEFRYKKKFLG